MEIKQGKRYHIKNGFVTLPACGPSGPEPRWALWYQTPNGRFNMAWWFTDGRCRAYPDQDITGEYTEEMG